MCPKLCVMKCGLHINCMKYIQETLSQYLFIFPDVQFYISCSWALIIQICANIQLSYQTHLSIIRVSKALVIGAAGKIFSALRAKEVKSDTNKMLWAARAQKCFSKITRLLRSLVTKCIRVFTIATYTSSVTSYSKMRINWPGCVG